MSAKDKLQELEEAYFGTIEDREPDSGISRKRHAHDGWRDGKSHPFELAGVTYDVDEDGKLFTDRQYQRLKGVLEAQTILEDDNAAEDAKLAAQAIVSAAERKGVRVK